MWKNKSVFNNFHGIFNILGAKKKNERAFAAFCGKTSWKSWGESVENKPLVGKTC